MSGCVVGWELCFGEEVLADLSCFGCSLVDLTFFFFPNDEIIGLHQCQKDFREIVAMAENRIFGQILDADSGCALGVFSRILYSCYSPVEYCSVHSERHRIIINKRRSHAHTIL